MTVGSNHVSNEIILSPIEAFIKRSWQFRHDGRKEKLMARECASKLQIKHFEVVAWPTEQISKGVVQILASSKKCESTKTRIPIAQELSGELYETSGRSLLRTKSSDGMITAH